MRKYLCDNSACTYVCAYVCTYVQMCKQTCIHLVYTHTYTYTKIINLKGSVFYTATKSKETKNIEDSDTEICNL